MANQPVTRQPADGDTGVVLLALLIVLMVITGSAASFIWFMNQQQTRAGLRYRSASALALAEAGVYRALSILETGAPDGTPGREWRPAGYSEVVPVGTSEGRFTLSLMDENDGAILISSTGEVGGVLRRLRAHVYMASAAQFAALYGTSMLRFENPPAATAILPYPTNVGDLPWIHVASGAGVWFDSTAVSINDPAVGLRLSPGPADALGSAPAAPASARPGPVILLLAQDADLMIDRDRQPVDIQQLRAMGLPLEGRVIRPASFPVPPEVDRAFYRAKATINDLNASLNKTVGEYFGDANFARKSDSLYSAIQFEQLQAYASNVGQILGLRGVVYVSGGLSLVGRDQLQIADGALVTEGTVNLDEGASLEITHSAPTRGLPGLLVLDDGALVVTEGARLRVHGLVYVNRLFEVGRDAHVDIVGSVLANDSGLSFHNSGGSILIRYDPAVLGTPGLRVPINTPVVPWVAAWEELP
jgi:hypothetical protein